MASLGQIEVRLDVFVSVATCERENLCQRATEKKACEFLRAIKRYVRACLRAVGSRYPW